jgi:hypothetical protein
MRAKRRKPGSSYLDASKGDFGRAARNRLQSGRRGSRGNVTALSQHRSNLFQAGFEFIKMAARIAGVGTFKPGDVD